MRSCGCPITGIQFELFVIGTRNWTTTWFMCQLHVLSWLPPHCFLQFSKLMKKQTSSQGMMLFMSINWPIVLKAHICQSDGGMSCDNSPNHIKESYLSASTKHWSHSLSFPLAFTITASISLLGDNIFPPHRSLIAIFWFDIMLCIFACQPLGAFFYPIFAENDNLITMDIVNN